MSNKKMVANIVFATILVTLAGLAYFFCANFVAGRLSLFLPTETEKSVIIILFGVVGGCAYVEAWNVIIDDIPRGVFQRIWRAVR